MKLNLSYILFIVSLLGCCLNASAEELTVVYPEVKAPYDKIFKQITRGIQSEFKGKVHHLKLPRTFDAEQQANKITTNKIIALGKRGMRIAKLLYNDKSIVVGALPIKPNGISGVSLMADPNILFDSLHDLAPNITTITVLYSPASEWIIAEAKIKAHKKGLILNSIAVDDIKAAVVAYNKIFEGSDLENTAIWLPLDPITANEKIIVPTILEKAWENKMVIFSSKPTHAKRGALFSTLPDNELLGQQLARLINTVNAKSRPSTVDTLEKIKLAVNLRTAAHLGFDYDTNERSGFALTFPD